MNLSIKIIPFALKDFKGLPDLYNILIFIEEYLGEHRVVSAKVGIFVFNTGEFMSEGEIIPKDKVIGYGFLPDIQKIL